MSGGCDTPRKRPRPPKETVTITFAITESPEGNLTLNCQVPDGAAGTVALLLANIAMDTMREGMAEVTGQKPPMTESRLQ
jgi:hypothetical protein